jgi:drug/metabolite transporter (DMT)-like permease
VLLLNKYLLSSYGFRYPIFLTMCHMAACAALSYVAVLGMKIVPVQMIRSRVQFMKICALSLVFCGSVVGGNISLRYLPISFNQAVGATAPLFTALFAYIATSKREPWLAYAALIPVVTGLIIASGVRIRIYTYICVCMYVCMYVCLFFCLFVCLFVCMHRCACFTFMYLLLT